MSRPRLALSTTRGGFTSRQRDHGHITRMEDINGIIGVRLGKAGYPCMKFDEEAGPGRSRDEPQPNGLEG